MYEALGSAQEKIIWEAVNADVKVVSILRSWNKVFAKVGYTTDQICNFNEIALY